MEINPYIFYLKFCYLKYYLYICTMKHVVFLCGIPASGKSTWVNEQINILPNSKIVSWDNIRKMFDYVFSEVAVSELFNKQLEEYVLNDDVEFIFIDNTNVKEKYINNIINFCLSCNKNCEFFIKVFDTPYDECIKRNNLRCGHEYVPIEVMERMKMNYDNFIKNLNNYINLKNIKIYDK